MLATILTAAARLFNRPSRRNTADRALARTIGLMMESSGARAARLGNDKADGALPRWAPADWRAVATFFGGAALPLPTVNTAR